MLARNTALPTRMVEEYHRDPGWVAAIAQSIRDHRDANHDARVTPLAPPVGRVAGLTPVTRLKVRCRWKGETQSRSPSSFTRVAKSG